MCIAEHLRYRSLAPLLLMVHASLALSGCPAAIATSREPPASCAKAGDTCTFSPGKLGVCVQPDDSRPSLVCQSLH